MFLNHVSNCLLCALSGLKLASSWLKLNSSLLRNTHTLTLTFWFFVWSYYEILTVWIAAHAFIKVLHHYIQWCMWLFVVACLFGLFRFVWSIAYLQHFTCVSSILVYVVHLLEWFLFIWLPASLFDSLAWVCVGVFLWLVLSVVCSFGCLFSVLSCNINKLQQRVSNTQAWTCRVKQSNTSITLHHKNQTTTQITTLAPQHQQRTRHQSKTEHTSNQLKHTSLWHEKHNKEEPMNPWALHGLKSWPILIWKGPIRDIAASINDGWLFGNCENVAFQILKLPIFVTSRKWADVRVSQVGVCFLLESVDKKIPSPEIPSHQHAFCNVEITNLRLSKVLKRDAHFFGIWLVWSVVGRGFVV